MDKIMKIWCSVLLLAGIVPEAGAQKIMEERVTVSNLAVSRADSVLFVAMDVDVSGLEVKTNREVILTPSLRKGADSLALPSLLIAGRNRYYHHLRNGLQDETMTLYRHGEDSVIEYRTVVPYASWMNTATLVAMNETCGCCGDSISGGDDSLLTLRLEPKAFVPDFAYVQPQAEAEKIREMRGSAFIDFPVNRTYIRENYRNNYAELQKIRNTIDVVRNDSDTYITSVFIKGFASPEASWATNTRLAKGRTEALKEYVRKLYEFPDSLMSTAYQPEDWEGLRRYVDTSSMANKAGILAIIDNDMIPDAKEYELKLRYPADYDFLYKNVYPGLRHSDYVVQYHVRTYSDVDEIRRIMLSEPQKLSLRELFLVAQACEPGSDEYNEVFAIAVRMFPEDEIANLNATNTALGLRDFRNAARYLEKAGNSPEAVYTRGVFAALLRDYDAAEALFKEASAKGIVKADAALKQLEEIRK